jgi:protein TonB
VLTAPASLRMMCWAASFGVHAVAFIAASHGPIPMAGILSASSDEIAVDVAPEPDAPPPVAVRAASFAPPTHTHPYPVRWDHDAHPHDPSLVHVLVGAPPRPQSVVPDLRAQPPLPLRFTMTVASVDEPRALGKTDATAIDLGSEPGPPSGALPLLEDRVSSPARLAASISPAYPPAARAQEREADVVLAIVVKSTGEVADAWVLRSAGFEFDQSALQAVRAARFVPAQREGRPVAVRMRWTVSFRLR